MHRDVYMASFLKWYSNIQLVWWVISSKNQKNKANTSPWFTYSHQQDHPSSITWLSEVRIGQFDIKLKLLFSLNLLFLINNYCYDPALPPSSKSSGWKGNIINYYDERWKFKFSSVYGIQWVTYLVLSHIRRSWQLSFLSTHNSVYFQIYASTQSVLSPTLFIEWCNYASTCPSHPSLLSPPLPPS